MNIQYDSSHSGGSGACFEVRHDDYFVLAIAPPSLSGICSMETIALFLLVVSPLLMVVV